MKISKITKTTLIATTLGLSLIATSCNKEDSPPLISSTIEGTWYGAYTGEDLNGNGILDESEVEEHWEDNTLIIDANKNGVWEGFTNFTWSEYGDKKYWFVADIFAEEVFGSNTVEAHIINGDLYLVVPPGGEYTHNFLLRFRKRN